MQITEHTMFAFTVGRTVAFALAVFWGGWTAHHKVNEVLSRQARTEQALLAMLTKADLADVEARIEKHVIQRLTSRNVVVSCPVLTVRGQSYKSCPIIGLAPPQEEP
jgi:hypothetical protein